MKSRLSLVAILLLVCQLLALEKAALPNGLEILAEKVPGSGLVTILLAVRTGSMHETEKTNGLAHLYEHMFFKGNKAYPNQEAFTQRMRELGIVHNGTTQNEVVKYFFTLPSEKLEAGMAFMSQALLTPLFDEVEFEKEKQVVIGEYDRFESRPDFHLWRAMEKLMFHKYFSRKNPIGDRQAILGASKKAMHFFRDHYYAPNNSALVVVGDFEPDEARRLAGAYFGSWKEKPVPQLRGLPPHPELVRSQVAIVEQEVDYVTVSWLLRGPDVDKQVRDTYVADFLAALLALPSGRFQQKLVESGLFTEAGFSYYTQKDGGEIWIEGTTTQAKAAEAVRALQAEIEQMTLSGYFQPEELERAKFLIEVRHHQDRESQASYANTLGFWWAVAGIEYYENYVEAIRSVSLAEVSDFVRRYLYGRPLVAGVLLPQQSRLKGEIESLLSQVSFAFPTQIQRATVGTIPVFLLPKPGPTIVLSAVFPGGSRNLSEATEGIETLLFNVLAKGSARYPKNDLFKKLEALGAALTAESTYDASSFTLSSAAETFYEAVPLWLDALEQPLIEEEEVALERERLVQALKQKESNPNDKVWRLANEVFFAGHPYRFSPEGRVETVERLDREVLLKHWENLRTQTPFVVVAGPVLGDELLPMLEASPFFQRRPAGEAAPLPAIPVRQAEQSRFLSRDIPTTYVVGKLPLPNLSSDDFAAAQLMMNLLSEKIEEEIRTKRALSYAAFSGMASYLANWGYLYVTTTKPRESLNLMKGFLDECKEDLFPAEWVEGVKGMMLTRQRMREEEAMGAAAALANTLLHGLPADKHGLWLKKLSSLSAEDVRDACRRLLSPLQFGVIGKEPL